MEMLIALIALLLGAVAGWIVRDRTAAQLLQKSEIARATAEATATRVTSLETDLARLRSSEQQLIREKAQFETATARVRGLEADLNAERAMVVQLTADKSRLETEQRNQQKVFDEKVAALTALREEIEKEFKDLANEALKGSQESFLKLANENFEKHRNSSTDDLEQRKKAIETLLAPFATSLNAYQKGLSELEKTNGGLLNELKNVAQGQSGLRAETSKLVNALRASPKTRGRWGEHQLHNVLELAGMTPYVDFFPEQTYVRDEERFRPDALIRLPGNRHIVVDAKTSMDAYLKAVEAVDDETREAHLKEHAQQMRQHMKRLAAKSYWDALTVTPDFVVMFVPGENFFAAAVERDPGLFEDAVKHRVLITTPTTLIALAKAIAFGWRQEKVAENARRIAELARDLYGRLQTMGDHVVGVGKHLENTVKTYNKFVGSLEDRVMPQGRKFNELEVEGTQQPLPELKPIETVVCQVRANRDLILPPSDPVHSLNYDGIPADRADGV